MIFSKNIDFKVPVCTSSNEERAVNGFYNTYVNWVSGEFDLYLQECSNNLKVFFPNGYFIVESIESGIDVDIIKVKIESKSRMVFQKTIKQLEEIYSKVVRLNELSN